MELKRRKKMGLVINTNTQSLFAQRALFKNTFNMQKSIEKLSTGFRINRAGDDAAGLTIAEKMTAEVKGLEKAKQNAMDGISLIQTAEGALSIVQDNVQRIRELFVQGSNETNSSEELDAIQREINERVKTVEDIAASTKFNGITLINNPADDIDLQTGANEGEYTTISLQATAAGLGVSIDVTTVGQNGALSEGAGVALDNLAIGGTVAAAGGATARTANGLDELDTMISNISRMRSYLGATQNSLESKVEYLDLAHENVSSSRSRIKDVDVAKESSFMVKNQILQQSAAAMLGQANSSPQLALNLLP
jgi:flagellin